MYAVRTLQPQNWCEQSYHFWQKLTTVLSVVHIRTYLAVHNLRDGGIYSKTPLSFYDATQFFIHSQPYLVYNSVCHEKKVFGWRIFLDLQSKIVNATPLFSDGAGDPNKYRKQINPAWHFISPCLFNSRKARIISLDLKTKPFFQKFHKQITS